MSLCLYHRRPNNVADSPGSIKCAVLSKDLQWRKKKKREHTVRVPVETEPPNQLLMSHRTIQLVSCLVVRVCELFTRYNSADYRFTCDLLHQTEVWCARVFIVSFRKQRRYAFVTDVLHYKSCLSRLVAGCKIFLLYFHFILILQIILITFRHAEFCTQHFTFLGHCYSNFPSIVRNLSREMQSYTK